MGIRKFISEHLQANKAAKELVALNENQEIIAIQVPELSGMNSVEGMAYVMTQIQDWNKVCTAQNALEFAHRLAGSHDAMKAEGLQLPYWANLWVLRTYQKELGFDVPAVALKVLDPEEMPL